MSRQLQLTWKGETVQFVTSFDLFMQIEEKVAFARIAEVVQAASRGHTADVPMSHIAWVLYCCLRHAGVAVRNPIEVHQALVGGGLSDYGQVVGGLITAYYGAAPEQATKKNEPETPATGASPRSGKKLPSATASP